MFSIASTLGSPIKMDAATTVLARPNITLIGQFLRLKGLVAEDRGKEVVVGSSQSTSPTPTDPQILELFKGFEDTGSMPPKRRNIWASLQAGTAGAGQSSNVESPPGRQNRQRRKRPRYGFRKELTASPSPPPLDKVDEESQLKEVATDVLIAEVRPSALDAEEPDYMVLRESDSLYQSSSVAATIIYGITKATDVVEHAKIPSL